MSSLEEYSLYSPNIADGATREIIGIVTQIDKKDSRPDLAEEWLRLAGCKKIFHISSYTGDGIANLIDYLKEDGDILPWEKRF
ncbi:Propanediol utilization protein PduV [compost metagenome]